MSAFAPAEFRAAMGRFCSGVVIVTGLQDEQPVGFTAQSFVSLSLEPPLVAVCPARSGVSWPRIRDGGHFGINVLSTAQRELCSRFARSGGTRFAGVDWEPGLTGSPRLPGVLGFVDCRLEAEHEAGDHTIAIGRVIDLRVGTDDHSPLLFYRGSYGGYRGLPALDAAVSKGS